MPLFNLVDIAFAVLYFIEDNKRQSSSSWNCDTSEEESFNLFPNLVLGDRANGDGNERETKILPGLHKTVRSSELMLLDKKGDHRPERWSKHGVTDADSNDTDPGSQAGYVTEKKVARENNNVREEDPGRVEADDVDNKSKSRSYR